MCQSSKSLRPQATLWPHVWISSSKNRRPLQYSLQRAPNIHLSRRSTPAQASSLTCCPAVPLLVMLQTSGPKTHISPEIYHLLLCSDSPAAAPGQQFPVAAPRKAAFAQTGQQSSLVSTENFSLFVLGLHFHSDFYPSIWIQWNLCENPPHYVPTCLEGPPLGYSQIYWLQLYTTSARKKPLRSNQLFAGPLSSQEGNLHYSSFLLPS